MICPKCGAELRDGAEFCTACGTQLVSTASSELQPMEAYKPERQNIEPPTLTFMPPIYGQSDGAAWARPEKVPDKWLLPLVFIMIFLILLIVVGAVFGYAVYTGRVLSVS